ncbi:hypothetical protein [Novosphingobium kaempferiae]|uniref:hypothetical protein n=1 Tax=Novosphingobium kaempferiae TaxID=2896849 RepID=UPI001E4D18F2|nr:hypothetical protein [Novosphingobium kaempferiae]
MTVLPVSSLAQISLKTAAALAPQVANQGGEVLIQRLGVGRTDAGMALEPDMACVGLRDPFQFGRSGVARAPTGAFDNHLEHVITHDKPPQIEV